jgi:predicted AAA+ superfamily ATPase
VDYLKEEILDEGLVRSLAPFSQFLELAALSDSEVLSWESFARDVGVSGPTIRSYFDVLSDTLIGSYLPAYVRRPKRKVVRAPKFFFSDVGVVNHLAQRGELRPGSELFGKALENWVHHELRCYLSYRARPESLSYWRLHQGAEVDFIVGQLKAAIEVKAVSRIHSEHLRGLKELAKEHPDVQGRYVVCLTEQPRETEDGIRIIGTEEFVRTLWAGELF